MIVFHKLNNSEHQNFYLRKVRQYLLELENIFYVCEGKNRGIDYKKLNIESSKYDHEYEQKVRRKELNFIYILDEILLSNRVSSSSAFDLISDLENYIFSPAFYRQIIFENLDTTVSEKLHMLTIFIAKKTEILKTKLTDQAYKKSVQELEFMMVPKNKDEFISELSSIIEFLRKKRTLIRLPIAAP